MSSILKALRKLEEDRARSEVRIPLVARDILKPPTKRRPPRWLASVCLGLVLIASGVAGYFLRGSLSFDPSQVSGVPSTDRIHESEKIPNLAGAPAAVSEQDVHVLASQAAATALEESPGSSSPAIPSETKKAPARPVSRPSTPEKATIPPVKQASPRNAAGRAALPPSLELTGIAFVKDRAERLAIINGLPVMEGTVIAGAKVQEIRADRVRLDYSGESFEVRLDPPEKR